MLRIFILAAVSSCALNACSSLQTRTVTVDSGTQFAVTGDTEALYFDMQGMLWKLPADGGPAVALTGALDDVRQLQLSPDGERLVAQSFSTGYWDIVVFDTDGRHRRNLTNSRYDDRDPAWSADGQSVLFSSDRSGNDDIWSLDIATGKLTQLTHNPANDFTPAGIADGFLFVSERNGTPALFQQISDDAPLQLAKAPAGRLYAPRASPNGRHIAWIQAAQRNGFPGVARNELVLYNTAGNSVQVLATDHSDLFNAAPAWLDDDTLLYTANGAIQRLNIATQLTRTVPFTAELPLLRSTLQAKTPLAFAQHAQPLLGIVDPLVLADKSIVFTALGDLWQLDTHNQLTQLTDDRFVERDLTVSPDGQQLAYISDRDGSMQIWSRNLQTGAATRLTDRANGPRYPTFSPDGRLLAYQQVGPIGVQDFTVRIFDPATRQSRKLRSSPKIWPGRMSWSADGTSVTVAELHKTGRTSDGRNRLVRININADTTDVVELPEGITPDAGPAAAPDGLQLALIIDGQLWRLPVTPEGAAAGAPELVLDGLVESPAWSADGAELLVLGARGLELVAIAGAKRTPRNPTKTWRPAGGNGRQLIHAGRLWDGEKDTYISEVDIVIDGTRITEVRPHAAHPAGIAVIDAAGHTVLPGLIDHHVHFEPHKGEWVGRSLLAFGVTTAVEPGGLPYESREHLESWLSGRRLGPRLVFAGPQLDGARRTFYFASHINSEERLRRELERGDRLGYGLLKTYRRMKPELQARTVELAHQRGLPVTAHAALRNIGFGGDRTEHLRGSSREAFSSKQSDLLHSYGDIRAIYSAPGVSLTPTLVNQGGFFDFALGNARGLDSINQYVALYTPAYRGNLDAFTRMVSRNIALIRTGLDNADDTLKALDDAGVNIVAGTDSPIFPYGLALIIELQNYVDAGLTPAAALRTATSNAAKAMGAADEVGSISAGKLADLVIVQGDPLKRITDLFDVHGVMLNGRYRPIDQLLE